MKYLKLLITVPLLLTFISSDAFAHDKKLHKGKPTEGIVASVTPEGFVLSTENKSYTIVVNEKTKFEAGDEQVDRDHLAKDSKVKVFGTKLPESKIVAREVLIELKESPEQDHDKQHKGHH